MFIKKVFEVEGVVSMLIPPCSDMLWYEQDNQNASKLVILANCPRFGFVEQPRLVMGVKLFWNETNISNPALDRVLQVGTWSLTDDGK